MTNCISCDIFHGVKTVSDCKTLNRCHECRTYDQSHDHLRKATDATMIFHVDYFDAKFIARISGSVKFIYEEISYHVEVIVYKCGDDMYCMFHNSPTFFKNVIMCELIAYTPHIKGIKFPITLSDCKHINLLKYNNILHWYVPLEHHIEITRLYAQRKFADSHVSGGYRVAHSDKEYKPHTHLKKPKILKYKNRTPNLKLKLKPIVAAILPTPIATVLPTPIATVLPTPIATVLPTPIATVLPASIATVLPASIALSTALKKSLQYDKKRLKIYKTLICSPNGKQLKRLNAAYDRYIRRD
jgi:hypothetical protein